MLTESLIRKTKLFRLKEQNPKRLIIEQCGFEKVFVEEIIHADILMNYGNPSSEEIPLNSTDENRIRH